MRYLFRIAYLSTLIMSSVAMAEPCPNLNINQMDVDRSAEWIVEGDIAEIKKTGSFKSCEFYFRLICASVDKPEAIVLERAVVIRGNVNIGQDGRAEIQRQSHCFSGALSSMNSKPELQAMGHRMRFFGNSYVTQTDVQPGYFWVQPAE